MKTEITVINTIQKTVSVTTEIQLSQSLLNSTSMIRIILSLFINVFNGFITQTNINFLPSWYSRLHVLETQTLVSKIMFSLNLTHRTKTSKCFAERNTYRMKHRICMLNDFSSHSTIKLIISPMNCIGRFNSISYILYEKYIFSEKTQIILRNN